MSEEKKYTILMFAPVDWGNFFRRHLMVELAKTFNIIVIESKTFIFPFPKTWRRWLRPWKGIRSGGENIKVFTPFSFLRLRRFRLINNLETSLYLRQIKNVIKRQKSNCDILWLCDPSQEWLVGLFNEKLSVYDCFDDYAAYPGISMRQSEEILAMEKKILGKVNVVFTTAKKLYEKCSNINKNTFYIPNAADIAHFKKALANETPIPSDIQKIKKPVVGLTGYFDERIDFELLEYLADTNPEWSLVLIGPFVRPDSKKYNVAFNRLASRENVYYLGERPYSKVPNYIKAFDVCIIPYIVNKSTMSVNPIKMYEYMAAGKPVVSTPLPEIFSFSDIVKIAESKFQFVEFVSQNLQANHENLAEQATKIVEENSWKRRGERVIEIISSYIGR